MSLLYGSYLSSKAKGLRQLYSYHIQHIHLSIYKNSTPQQIFEKTGLIYCNNGETNQKTI